MDAETILLADDNDLLLRGLAAMLRNRGYTVITARCGAEAVQLARLHPGPIHLLLTDCELPRVSGPALAETFGSLRPGTPIVLMSGYLAETTLTSPVVGFLQKPFTSDELGRVVRGALDRQVAAAA